MKNLKPRLKVFTLFLLSALAVFAAGAQCTSTTLNWDYLDYFYYTGKYSSGYLPNLAAAQTQHFTFGTQRVTISHGYSSSNFFGEDGMHTGETNALGQGDDLHFKGNGTITITFENEVEDVEFSLFDVDYKQKVTVSAVNGAATALPVGLSQANFNLNVAIALFPFTAPSATANTSRQGNTSSTNTINVSIAGPVKEITLDISNTATKSGEDGSFWISDITACSPGTFPTNYFSVSQPFTGQSGYVLNAFNNEVYALDPSTGKAHKLFTDNLGLPSTGAGYINSMAYDPYGRKLYYVYSLTGDASNNRLIRVYDFATNTISTALNDVNTIGIPTTSRGVESGAGAFYNGSYYIGIEANESSFNGNREALIWRIDFDGSGTAYRASQAFGVTIDNGSGTLLHDWADFTITDGVLYDFDGAGKSSGDQTDVYIYDMVTGNATVYNKIFTNSAGSWLPGQPTVGWDNTIYNIHANSSASWPTIYPYVAAYNPVTNVLGSQLGIYSTPAYIPSLPSLGDAAEGFRPYCDFGDAPASYDPNPLSPAVHERYEDLRLGTTWGSEWTKISSVLADADNADEDGLAYTNVFNSLITTYYADVDVYNNTGANAVAIGWLDYNGNGIFDAGEASATETIPSSGSMQPIHLSWSGISSSLPFGAFTYLRVRIASAASGMAAANATGFFETGEVEDYRVYVGLYPLAVDLLSFEAGVSQQGNALLEWNATEEADFAGYVIEKSLDGQHWQPIGYVAGQHQGITQVYQYIDQLQLQGKTYYRLHLQNVQQTAEYSEIRTVSPAGEIQASLAPNPAKGFTTLRFHAQGPNKPVTIQVTNLAGRTVYETQTYSTGMPQEVAIPIGANWPGGTYIIIVQLPGQRVSQKLIVNP